MLVTDVTPRQIESPKVHGVAHDGYAQPSLCQRSQCLSYAAFVDDIGCDLGDPASRPDQVGRKERIPVP